MKAKLFLIAIAALISNAFGAASLSGPQQPGTSAAGSSFNPQFSADGQHIVFVSHANNLVLNDNLNPHLDVFVRDLVGSNTVLVSVNTSGFGGANADGNYPSISSNGQFIAFASRASNLVGGDANNAIDVFVRDMNAGLTRLVSVNVTGNSPADPSPTSIIPLSGNPLISADGRWVFFESRATNLITGGAPLGSVNIYARDTWSNATVLVTAGTNGNPLAGISVLASITPDARYIAFTTTNQSVLPGVNNPGPDVYVRDLPTAATRWASTNTSLLLGGPYACSFPTLAANGSGLAFNATASNSGDTFPFHFDLQTGLRRRLILSSISNTPPVISADGSGIAFANVSNGWTQILLWRTVSPANNFVSVAHEKILGNYPGNRSQVEALSSDARFLLFREFGVDSPFFTTNFVPRYQLFRKDLTSNTLELVSSSVSDGASMASFEYSPVTLSPDGSLIAFDCTANDLESEDLNGMSDIFLRDMDAGATELITKAQPTKPAATSFAHSFLGPNSVSADGRFIVSTRYDDPSAYRDTNGWADVFVSDALSGLSVAVTINTNLYYTNSDEVAGITGGMFIDNTNVFQNPVLSADGSTLMAVRRANTGFGSFSGIYGTALSNAFVIHNGLSLVTRPLPNYSITGNSDSPSLSADGDRLAFRSDDIQFDYYPDNNGFSDIWLRYTRRSEYYPYQRTTNYALLTSGIYYYGGNGPSIAPTIDSDGGQVVFATKAGDLLTAAAGGTGGGGATPQYSNYQIVCATFSTNRNDTNYLYKIRKRLCSYTLSFQPYAWLDSENTNIFRMNSNAVLTPIPADITNAIFSGDSHFLIYSLGDGSSVWRHDLLKSQTNYTFVSNAPYPNQAGSIVATNVVPGAHNLLVCSNCRNPSVSFDGNIVAYERVRSGSGTVDLFAIDLATGAETLVSGNFFGGLANGSSISPVISADGRYVVFASKGSDLVANDTNGVSDIFVRDGLLGVTVLVSANAQGRPGDGPSTRPVLAADGRTVVFQSFARDLVSGDYNEKRDIFILKLGGADTDGDGMDDDWEVIYFSNLSRDGNGDFDSDGVSDRDEFFAGTNPTANASIFRLLTVTPAGGGSALVLWAGNPDRTYRVDFKDDLNAVSWTPLTGAISWNGTTASITDTNTNTSTHRYYRAARLP